MNHPSRSQFQALNVEKVVFGKRTDDRKDRGLAMAGGLNGAAAGNRRAQGEQMSQWTNKSNKGVLACNVHTVMCMVI
ncbi:unnamed protein product [Sphagnum jensenii]|uniref:Uncharacterized protein n=1 Tax=Sphagnum jensenii TaxID=128206 RepID=A0ABP1AZD8_9BRYO